MHSSLSGCRLYPWLIASPFLLPVLLLMLCVLGFRRFRALRICAVPVALVVVFSPPFIPRYFFPQLKISGLVPC